MTSYTELGSALRTARQNAGRSVSDMSVDTGLPERYVQALEEGDLAALPDLSYARLYCQSYARALQLDVEEVMQSWPHTRKVESLPNPTPAALKWRWPVLVLLAATGIWVLVQVSIRGGGEAEPSGLEAHLESPGDLLAGAGAGAEAEAKFSAPSALLLPAMLTLADSQPQASVAPHLMILEVTAAVQSWVVIEADGDTVEARVLVKDQSLRAEAESEFRLTATNARGLRVQLDGLSVPLDARADRPLIRHRITGKDSP